MLNMKSIARNPAAQHMLNWLQITNAVAEQNGKKGKGGSFSQPIAMENAQAVYAKLIASLSDFGNVNSTGHNAAFNAIRSDIQDREALQGIENLGQNLHQRKVAIMQNAMSKGATPEQASAAAINSIAGNPNFDHFANLNVMSEPLFEQKTFVQSFLDEGDAFALPIEAGGTGTDKSRFRFPIASVSGSAKQYQGDINPFGEARHNDTNGVQVNFQNDFKDAKTEYATFIIDQANRDQALGYASAVAPALAGLVLQNLYTEAALEFCMKNAELCFVDGQFANAAYTPLVGGGYGLLSSAIHLTLGDYTAESPVPATASNWVANPTKLIQKIANYYYKPTDVTAPLPSGLDGALMYKDVVRLLNLYAVLNVNTQARNLTLYVPTTYYGFAVQYLGDPSLYTKQLNEAISQATLDLIKKIVVKPSGLLGARTNQFGQAQKNFFALVAHGAPNGKKGCIMPGQTAVPVISSETVSQQRMSFSAQYIHGGPAIAQTGQVFLLEFSEQAS